MRSDLKSLVCEVFGGLRGYTQQEVAGNANANKSCTKE